MSASGSALKVSAESEMELSEEDDTPESKRACPEQIQAAFLAMMERNLSLRAAAHEFGVSINSLRRRKKAGTAELPLGRRRIVGDTEIGALKELVTQRTRDGSVPTVSEIKEYALTLAHEFTSPSVSDMSDSTARRLLQQLRERGLSTASGISTVQARLNANSIMTLQPFFDKVEHVACKLYPALMIQPFRIWAVDESPVN